jgi:peptidoglycan/LPS O-acetylase OafA/YrhL
LIEVAERRPGDAFRPDLEGLRGVAILAVLLFHAGVPGTGGGFIGVDVFFVLSGFLITGLLLREREERGAIDLAGFYARRARRILPAAAVVLLAILIASWVILAPLDVPGVAGDVLASILFVGNIRFALQATDYFAADVLRSPVLHYWSLGVEEQFYLLWPFLLIIATRFRRVRLSAGLLVGAVFVLSLVFAVVMTDVDAPWAFYSLPGRAWQLALGGLLAVGGQRLARLPWSVSSTLGWAGLAAVVASVAFIGPEVPYPGVAALLPSLGAAGLILAGAGRLSPAALLATPPLRFLGRISYSLYLVHWPILVLPAATLAVGEELPLPVRAGLAAASVVVATLSYRLVEQPFHRGWLGRRRPRPTLAFAGVAICAIALVATAVDLSVLARLQAPETGVVSNPGPEVTPDPGEVETPPPWIEPDPSESPGDEPSPSGSVSLSPQPGFTPTPAPTGMDLPTDRPTQQPTPKPTAPPTPKPTAPPALALPPDVQPALVDARSDSELIARDGCLLGTLPTVPHSDCWFGDSGGSKTVALVGDSHAAVFFPPLNRIAKARGWRLVAYTKISCRFLDLPLISRELQREYTECETWRENVVALLQAHPVDLSIFVVARGMEVVNQADDDPRVQGHSLARMMARIPGKHAVIVDTPQSIYDPPACLSANLDNVWNCATPRNRAFNWRYLKLEKTATDDSGARLINLSDDICPGDPCPAVLNRMIVYRDVHHLTATFALSLAPELEAALPDP